LASPSARAAADPVLAIIEAHKTAWEALGEATTQNDLMEQAGIWNDPEHALALATADHPEQAALADLVETVPTTHAGVVASLTYFGGLVENGCGHVVDEDYLGTFLANLAEAIENLAVAS
jgi:hypothetical protein